VSPITERDFQSALPLSPRVRSAISAAFESGWGEPQKLHQSSAKLRQALGEAREVIAIHLGLAPAELEFVGELGFGYWSAFTGLQRQIPDSLIHSPIDRQIIHAFSREIANSGGVVRVAEVNGLGQVKYGDAISTNPNSVVVWQGTNRETGIEQEFPRFAEKSLVFADLTARFDLKLTEAVDVALWDPRSIGGPEGLAILGIPNGSRWRSPIPQIDQRRLFGSYSKPLLLAAAVAIDEWMTGLSEKRRHLAELNKYARKALASTLPVRVVGESAISDPRFLALVFDGVIAEELLREMEKSGFLIDAGSACGAGAMQPSHVLSALGFGIDGHIRLTLKLDQAEADIDLLCAALGAALGRIKG
jgi:cysteine desulfurase